MSFEFCPRCGTPRAAGSRFCVSCGLDLDAPEAGNAPGAETITGRGVNVHQPVRGSHTALLAVVLVAAASVLAVGLGLIKLPGSSATDDRITFIPPVISCASPVDWTISIRLPASVTSGDTLTLWADGHNAGSFTIDPSQTGFGGVLTALPEGGWMITKTQPASSTQSTCASGGMSGGVAVMAPGTHQLQLKDSGGVVVAAGSYTAR